MNETFLDALLIDRALGALPPETEALLEAYLAQNRGLVDELDKTVETVNLARDVFKEEESLPLPAYQAPLRIRQRKVRRYTLQTAGMAATLAIGFLFGHYRIDSAPASAPISMHAVAEIEPAPKAPGIWTITPDRLRRRTRQPSSWKWHSPVQQPKLNTSGDGS